jgi:cell division protein FtsB
MWKKISLTFFGVLVFGLLFVEGRSLWQDKEKVRAQYEQMQAEVSRAEKERSQLTADIEYLSLPENFEKEIRSRFNFHLKDEKTIIVVPIEATSAIGGAGTDN